MPLSPGTRLGSYEIIAALGSGGMGEVYRAHDRKLNRAVASKVLPAVLNEAATFSPPAIITHRHSMPLSPGTTRRS